MSATKLSPVLAACVDGLAAVRATSRGLAFTGA
jgi:hypothetical protein